MTTRRYDSGFGMLSLREAMYRLLEDNYVQSAAQAAVSREASVAVDLYETRDTLVARFALPGVAPEDIDVTLTAEVLTVRGEWREYTLEPGSRYLLREQHPTVFVRRLTLPVQVQSDHVRAETANGILILTMPKVEQAMARTIKINARPTEPTVIEGETGV